MAVVGGGRLRVRPPPLPPPPAIAPAAGAPPAPAPRPPDAGASTPDPRPPRRPGCSGAGLQWCRATSPIPPARAPGQVRPPPPSLPPGHDCLRAMVSAAGPDPVKRREVAVLRRAWAGRLGANDGRTGSARGRFRRGVAARDEAYRW